MSHTGAALAGAVVAAEVGALAHVPEKWDRFSDKDMRKLKESSVSGAIDHEAFLRKAFDVARRARKNGNHPFGAILVGPQGELLIECENGFMPDHDMTAHAERLLATQASRTYEPAFLARCTVYASAEPCAMCAGAVYWAGIGRVVFGMTERRLKTLTGDHAENPTLDLPCRTVFAAGQRQVEVIGPLLEDEAADLHAGAWDTG